MRTAFVPLYATLIAIAFALCPAGTAQTVNSASQSPPSAPAPAKTDAAAEAALEKAL